MNQSTNCNCRQVETAEDTSDKLNSDRQVLTYELRSPRHLVETGLKAKFKEMPNTAIEAGGFKVGDQVTIRPDTLAFRAEFKLQNETGEIIQIGKNGRISIRFANGQILKGRAIDSFELVI